MGELQMQEALQRNILNKKKEKKCKNKKTAAPTTSTKILTLWIYYWDLLQLILFFFPKQIPLIKNRTIKGGGRGPQRRICMFITGP
jgi:hypothetical protein